MSDIFREATFRGLMHSSFGFFREQMRAQYSGFGYFTNWLGMLWCVARHGSSPAEYAQLNFDKKSDRERARYFTMLRFERFIKKVNTGDKQLFINKAAFNRRFAAYLNRDWLDLSQARASPAMTTTRRTTCAPSTTAAGTCWRRRWCCSTPASPPSTPPAPTCPG